MLAGRPDPTAGRRPHNHRELLHLSAAHIAHFRGLIGQIIKTDRSKINKHDFRHGPHPHQCSPKSRSHDGSFRYRGVHHPFRTEFIVKTGSDAETTTESPYVFTEYEHVVIELHFMTQCLTDGLSIGNLAHYMALLSS